LRNSASSSSTLKATTAVLGDLLDIRKSSLETVLCRSLLS
jgi:hypothetical protein